MLLQESQAHKCLSQLIGFTLHLHKFITGPVSGISIKKDLFVYLIDVISNSDLTSWTVHTEDIKKKNPNKNPTKMQNQVILTH